MTRAKVSSGCTEELAKSSGTAVKVVGNLKLDHDGKKKQITLLQILRKILTQTSSEYFIFV